MGEIGGERWSWGSWGGSGGRGWGEGGVFSDWLNCLRDQQPEILFCVQ